MENTRRLNIIEQFLPNTRIEVIETTSVNFSDTRFVIPNYEKLDNLISSIRTVGIINDPFVLEDTGSGYVSVLGYRRLLAAGELEMEKITVRIVDQSASEQDCYEASFWDNIGHRLLDPSSKAQTLARLMELFPRMDVIQRFLPFLGVPAQGPKIERALRIGALCGEALSNLALGRIHERTAFTMSFRSKHEQQTLMKLINKFGLNLNNASQVIEDIIDIATVKGVEIDKVIGELNINELETTQAGQVYDGKKLKNAVKRLKDPGFELTREENEAWVKTLNVPKFVRITPANSFEDKSFQIAVSLESMEDLELCLKAIKEIIPT